MHVNIPFSVAQLTSHFAFHIISQLSTIIMVHFVCLCCSWLRYVLVLCYHMVVLGSHLVAIHDIIPYIGAIKSTTIVNMPALMYHLWALHTLSYFLCILSNPGIIHNSNHSSAMVIYPYDGEMYKPEQVCHTCQFNKPARSKHCSKLS